MQTAMRTPGYEPIFLTTSLRTILKSASIDPDKFVKVKSGNKVRTVSPLGHSEGSMAAAIDMLLLKGVVEPHTIIDTMDADTGLAEQRKKFLKTKNEINTPDLLAKIDSHFVYYTQRHFDEFFTRTFGVDPKVVRAIRKACTAYRENTWKPGLKEYKKALDMACLKVAEEIAKGESNTMALQQLADEVADTTPTEGAPTALTEGAVAESTEATENPVIICQGTTKAGLPCKARAGADGFCRAHSPKAVN